MAGLTITLTTDDGFEVGGVRIPREDLDILYEALRNSDSSDTQKAWSVLSWIEERVDPIERILLDYIAQNQGE